MSKIAQYLQSHLVGEVLTSAKVRKFFSTDASILQQTPAVVLYPRHTSDVRKIAKFCWQLAEKGHILPITARGRGSDVSGGAIGNGAIVVFPAHMNRMLELDTKQRLIRVQPGMTFRSMQDVLMSHGLFVPTYPSSYDYATIGGAIANNAGGEKSVKYGMMRDYVQNLEVVLSNGDVMQTSRLSARDLSRKKGLDTLEGEIYRQIDNIITDNEALLKDIRDHSLVTNDATGYGLVDVKQKNGSFDLTPLLVGSQGTLGLVTEAIVAAEVHNPKTVLAAISCQSYEDVQDCVTEIRKLIPSALEFIDESLLSFAAATNKNILAALGGEQLPQSLLIVEFDDDSERKRTSKLKRMKKLIKDKGMVVVESHEYEAQQEIWLLRRSSAALLLSADDKKAAVPLIEDATVPIEKIAALIDGAKALLVKQHVDGVMWGSIGEGNLRVHPLLDLSVLSDRQKVFRLMSDYQTLVSSLGGTMSGQHGDGRLRAPLLRLQAGEDVYPLYQKIKAAFDPHGLLNPGVKLQEDPKAVIALFRDGYSLDTQHDFLPH